MHMFDYNSKISYGFEIYIVYMIFGLQRKCIFLNSWNFFTKEDLFLFNQLHIYLKLHLNWLKVITHFKLW